METCLMANNFMATAVARKLTKTLRCSLDETLFAQ
jgi:hypothetical protein